MSGITLINTTAASVPTPPATKDTLFFDSDVLKSKDSSGTVTTYGTGGGSGTVTTVSVASANGFAGTVANPTTTPAITVSTSITGVLKGNGTAISAATSGTDYSAGTAALTTGIVKTTTATGVLTIAVASDFPTLNQNTTGTSANVTGVVAVANGGTGLSTIPTNTILRGNGTGNVIAATTLEYDGTTLTLGSQNTTNNIVGTQGTTNNATSLNVQGGQGTSSTFAGGNVSLMGGTASGTGNAGSVSLVAGISTSGTSGSVNITTGGTNRLTVDPSGAWLLASAAGTSGQVLTSGGAGAVPTWTTVSGGGGSGTVTSVAVSGANGIGVSGSPITSSGTVALTLGAITPTSVVASGAVSGSNLSGTNTGDQTITLTGAVTGTGTGSFATTYAGTVPATVGGTAQTTWTSGDLMYSSATNTLSKLAIGTTGQVLTVVSGAPAWAAAGGGSTNYLLQPVRAATVANGTLATAYANGSVVDAVTLVTGDRILLVRQTTQSENGIYTVNATGAPTRAADFTTGAATLTGYIKVTSTNGTVNAGVTWECITTAAITIGTTSINFRPAGGVMVSTVPTNLLPNNAFATSIVLGNAINNGSQSVVLVGGATTVTNGGGSDIIISAGGGNPGTMAASNIFIGTDPSASGFGTTSSTIIGGNCTTTFPAEFAYGYGSVGNSGANVTSFLRMLNKTTDATPTDMGAGAGQWAGAPNQHLTLSADTTYLFDIQVTARNTALDTDSAAFVILVACRQGTTASTMTIIGTPSITTFADSSASTWTVVPTADTTDGRLQLICTGQTSKTIMWTASVRITGSHG